MEFRLWIESEWQRFGHQRTFPWLRKPKTPFQQYAKSALGADAEDFNLDISEYKPEKLYHVTTNLPGVKSVGWLKSRSELGNTTIGLGGGPSNMAPNLISLTYNYSKALEIYNGLRFVADIVRNRVPASQIYDYIVSSSYDDEHSVDQVLRQFVPRKYIKSGDENQIKAIIDKKIITPEQKYEFLQSLENAVLEDNPPDENSEYPHFDPTVGFTAPFETIRNLNPQNIAIIQVVIRKNAPIDHYQPEAEIRVKSRDIAVIRFMQPK